MDIAILQNLLKSVSGCTFATLDAITHPVKGVDTIRCEMTGERVLLFATKDGKSGYELKVKRALLEAGKNADNFTVSDLPWGERIDNSPIIMHNGRYYLQTIQLSPGKSRYYIVDTEVDPRELGLRQVYPSAKQGLPEGESVIVHTYLVDNITRIAAMNEILVADDKSVLPVNP